MEGIASELHAPARRKYCRRKVQLRGIGDTWQMDLMDLGQYFRSNKSFKYALIIIDIFTKYVWYAPLKTKKGEEIAENLNTIISKNSFYGPPRNIHSDKGKEFINSTCKNLYRKYDITYYHTESETKASIVERVIRTLKEKLFKKFTSVGSYEWVKSLAECVKKYNNSKHSTTNMKPVDVRSKSDAKKVFSYIFHSDLYSKSKCWNKITKPVKTVFKIGDYVRISRYKDTFEKGYTPNWSTKIYVIEKIFKTIPVTYALRDDEMNSPIAGRFYKEELKATKYPKTFLVEKIVSRNPTKKTVRVKWLGFPGTQEIPMKDVLPNN